MKPIFGLDIDGCLYDWHGVVYDLVLDKNTEKRSPREFWANAHLKNEPYTTLWWYNVTHDLSLLTKRPPIKGSLEAVLKLSEHFDIVYITHRSEDLRFTTTRWLDSYGFPGTDRIHMSDLPKAETVRAWNCDYFVDDREHIIKSLYGITNIIGVRKDWHSEDWEKSPIPVVDSVAEIPSMLGL